MKTNNRENNIISIIFKGSAFIIFIDGFFLGILELKMNVEIIKSVLGTEEKVIILLIIWICSFIIGMIFLAIGEIIKLLHKIANK